MSFKDLKPHLMAIRDQKMQQLFDRKGGGGQQPPAPQPATRQVAIGRALMQQPEVPLPQASPDPRALRFAAMLRQGRAL